MKKIIILLAVLTIMTAQSSSGAEYNYTWKDKNGILNITDYPPPEDAEVIDVSVIPVPEEKVIAPVEKKGKVKQTKQQNESRNRLQAEARSLRKEAASLRQQAENLKDEAMEQRRLSKLNKYNSRYRSRASKKEAEAEKLLSRADTLAAKAGSLERQASRLK